MNDSNIQQLQNIIANIQSFIPNQFPQNTELYLQQLQTDVCELLKIEKPKVMVYGIYNAGKSTLINALLRQEMAQVADRPTTSRIDEYDKGDYILVDSPGINAPMVHEEVTQKHLKKCHVLLFVISTKGLFEDRYNYEKMYQLICENIPFIIVLNDRGVSSLKSDSPQKKEQLQRNHKAELLDIEHKVIDNLVKISGTQQIVNQYELMTVNAKKAVTGMRQTDEKKGASLYELSGVDELHQRLSTILLRDNRLHLLQQPVQNLLHILSQMEVEVASGLNKEEQQQFNTQLNTIAKKRETLQMEMSIRIRQIVDGQLSQFIEACMADNNNAISNVEDAIIEAIQQAYAGKKHSLRTYLETEFKGLHIQVDDRCRVKFPEKSVYQGTFHESSANSTTSTLGIGRKSSAIFDVVESFGSRASASNQPFKLSDLFKSRQQKEDERRSELEAQAEIANANAIQAATEALHRRRQLRQNCQQTLDEIKLHTVKAFNQDIAEVFDEIESSIKQAVYVANAQQDIIKNVLTQITAFKRQVEEIQHNII